MWGPDRQFFSFCGARIANFFRFVGPGSPICFVLWGPDRLIFFVLWGPQTIDNDTFEIDNETSLTVTSYHYQNYVPQTLQLVELLLLLPLPLLMLLPLLRPSYCRRNKAASQKAAEVPSAAKKNGKTIR